MESGENMIEPGDTVKWISDDLYVGPRKSHLAIKKGETRKVLFATDDSLMLTGRFNSGAFGWTSVDNVEKVYEDRNSTHE